MNPYHRPPITLESSVDELEFSIRTENILRNMYIKTVGELTDCTSITLKKQRGFGKKCLQEIREKLFDLDLCLKDDIVMTSQEKKELFHLVPEELNAIIFELDGVKDRIERLTSHVERVVLDITGKIKLKVKA